MNFQVILVTLCAYFVIGVRSSYRPYYCDKIEDNDENAAIFENCVGDNYPEALLDLVTKCYRQEFGDSDGTWQDLIRILCDIEGKREKLEKYLECLIEGEDKALSNAGISEEDAERGEEAGEICISEKLGRGRRDASNLEFI